MDNKWEERSKKVGSRKKLQGQRLAVNEAKKEKRHDRHRASAFLSNPSSEDAKPNTQLGFNKYLVKAEDLRRKGNYMESAESLETAYSSLRHSAHSDIYDDEEKIRGLYAIERRADRLYNDAIESNSSYPVLEKVHWLGYKSSEGAEEIKKLTEKKGGLEKSLGVIGGVGLLAGIATFSTNMTGSIIGNTDQGGLSIATIIITILAGTLASIYLRKR